MEWKKWVQWPLSNEKVPLNMFTMLRNVFLNNLLRVLCIEIVFLGNREMPIIKLVRSNQLIEHAKKAQLLLKNDRLAGFASATNVQQDDCRGR